jgi:hypothetical protein
MCILGWFASLGFAFLAFALQGLADTHRPVPLVEQIGHAILVSLPLAFFSWALFTLWRRAR